MFVQQLLHLCSKNLMLSGPKNNCIWQVWEKGLCYWNNYTVERGNTEIVLLKPWNKISSGVAGFHFWLPQSFTPSLLWQISCVWWRNISTADDACLCITTVTEWQSAQGISLPPYQCIVRQGWSFQWPWKIKCNKKREETKMERWVERVWSTVILTRCKHMHLGISQYGLRSKVKGMSACKPPSPCSHFSFFALIYSGPGWHRGLDSACC